MQHNSKGLYQFGPYFLDRDRTNLTKDGEDLLLPPKLFELLAVLVCSRGEVVTKDQLLEAVWPDAFVEESNLTQGIFSLRKRLGKPSDGEEYIQTVPRRGYRLRVPVTELGRAASSSGSTTAIESLTASLSEASVGSESATWWDLWKRRRMLWLVPTAVLLLAALLTTVLLQLLPNRVGEVRYVQLTRDGLDKRGKTGEMGGPDAPLATDGSRIYFTEGSSNAPRLVQVAVTGGETVQIPLPFPIMQLLDYSTARSELLVGDYTNPAAPAQLWAVAVPGGTAHRLGELRATDASWSPDGSHIAYVDRDSLFLATSSGSDVKRIALLPGIGWRPRWSPDGRMLRLTIVDARSAEQSIWEVASDGSRLHRLFTGWEGSSGQCCGTWTSDGKEFLFQATRFGKTEVWSMAEPDMLSSIFHLQREPIQVSSGPGDSLVPVANPNDSRIFVIGRQLRGELVRYDSGARQFVTYMNGASLDFLEFSRDGQWITYVAYPAGTLWRSKTDGSDRLQLTFAPMQVMVPHWSPDGRQIVFHGFGSGTANGTYTVSAEGGVPKLVAPNSSNMMNPHWSPDGKSLTYSDFPFFGAKPEDINLHIMSLETQQVASLPQSQGLISPTWSPDGRYITAFKLNGQQDVMLFDTKTQSWSELVKGWGLLRWSHDGKSLYYFRYGAEPAIMRVRIADRHVDEVADVNSLRLGGRLAGLEFSLDPNDVPVLLRDTGSQEIYSLQQGPR